LRESFDSLGALLGFYQYLKMNVTSIPSILPKKDFGDNTQKFRAKCQQMSIEEKFSFIGDIELFPTNYYYFIQRGYKHAPPDCLMLIFYLKFCPVLSRFNSYGHLALHFRKRFFKKEMLPKRLIYKQHLQDIAQGMNKEILPYFVKNGYLISPICDEYIA
jgi:hypothetical protein